MKDPMKEYDIPITSLKAGVHTFSYDVTQDLMDYFGYEDHWDDARVKVDVRLEKRGSVMRLDIDVAGDIRTWCDVTDEEFRLPIKSSDSFTVKVQEIETDDDQVIVLSPLDTVLNVGQYIYEVIVLSVPQKRYHPSYIDKRGGVDKTEDEKWEEGDWEEDMEWDDDDAGDTWSDEDWEEEDLAGEDYVMDSNVAPIYSTENTEDPGGDDEIDPRWAKLKDILNNKTK